LLQRNNILISRVYIVKNILFFTFLANIFFGPPYTNITVLMLPLNEWMLIISLALIMPNILGIIKSYPIVIPILSWSFGYLLLSVPFGFSEYGIWAGRDALHLIEVWWLVVILFVLSRIDSEYELKKTLKIIFYLLIVKLIVILLGDTAKGIFIIQGVQGEMDLIGSTAGFSLAVFLMIWTKVAKIHTNVLIAPIVIIFFVFLQSRYMYIGLISSLFIYLLVQPPRRVLNIISKVIISSLFLLILLQFLSTFSFLDQYTRFGMESISPYYIYHHLLSSLGSSDVDNFVGASKGVGQRIEWFIYNWNIAINDGVKLFFGQGFGPVLTDFVAHGKIVREPHNSYLSVFARTGLIGFILWVFFHVYINTQAFFIIKKNIGLICTSFSIQTLFVAFMAMHAMYLYALVESAYESPYSAIPFYIILGTMTYLIKRYKYEQ